MNKLVSIIIPVYNVSKYLEECLNSIQNQTYKNIEIILVDDGSTDKSGIICDNYSISDTRFKVLHQENFGAAAAKNNGIDHAIGDYITFLDSDDYVENNWIETMVSVLEKYNVDMVECQFDKVYTNRIENVEKIYNEKVLTNNEYLYFYLQDWTCSLFCLKLFKREVTDDIRFRNERRCIDDEFYTYKIVSNASKIKQIENVLVHYRQRKNSAVSSQKNYIQKTYDALDILIERYEWIKNYCPELKERFFNHDLEILHYICNDFIFEEGSKKLFQIVRKYYSQEMVRHYLSIKNIYLIILLYFRKKNENGIESIEINKCDFYFE